MKKNPVSFAIGAAASGVSFGLLSWVSTTNQSNTEFHNSIKKLCQKNTFNNQKSAEEVYQKSIENEDLAKGMLTKTHITKNIIYGLTLETLWNFSHSQINLLMLRFQINPYFQVVLAPFYVFSYYYGMGYFDNLDTKETNEKLTTDLAMLTGIGVVVFGLRGLSNVNFQKNFEIAKKQNLNRIPPGPKWIAISRMLTTMFWRYTIISKYEGREVLGVL